MPHSVSLSRFVQMVLITNSLVGKLYPWSLWVDASVEWRCGFDLWPSPSWQSFHHGKCQLLSCTWFWFMFELFKFLFEVMTLLRLEAECFQDFLPWALAIWWHGCCRDPETVILFSPRCWTAGFSVLWLSKVCNYTEIQIVISWSTVQLQRLEAIGWHMPLEQDTCVVHMLSCQVAYHLDVILLFLRIKKCATGRTSNTMMLRVCRLPFKDMRHFAEHLHLVWKGCSRALTKSKGHIGTPWTRFMFSMGLVAL